MGRSGEECRGGKKLWNDGYVHYLGCADRHTYVKTHHTVHFKYVKFIVCQLYSNKAYIYTYVLHYIYIHVNLAPSYDLMNSIA